MSRLSRQPRHERAHARGRGALARDARPLLPRRPLTVLPGEKAYRQEAGPMRRVPTSVIVALALAALAVYLFVQAPAPLPEPTTAKGRTIPIETALAIVAAENDVARALYTSEIVGAGKAAGFAFDERWRDPAVQAGPLPALFLREAAKSLLKSPVRLGLFLGSDFPISPANRFTGRQQDASQKIGKTQKAEFFYAEDTQLYTAMFPDYASAPECVDCHNRHAQSPKKDWKLNDMMG